MKSSDMILRGNSADGNIRVFAAITTDTVNTAQQIHHTYPTATAALGRTLTGAALMGATLKNESDSQTIQIKGDGPISYIVAISDNAGNVKGYAANPLVDIPLNEKGKLDVGGAVGHGYLSVIKDLGMKEPYIGQIELVSGEIAEDLTAYYAQSEQIPTAIALGVLVDTDNSVIASGGFMIQLMPDADEDTITRLENILKELPPITKMISDGMSCEDIIFKITDGFDMLISNASIPVKYSCDCSHEKMERALISIGKDELQKIYDEQGSAELCCQFCDNKYTFTKEAIKNMISSIPSKK